MAPTRICNRSIIVIHSFIIVPNYLIPYEKYANILCVKFRLQRAALSKRCIKRMTLKITPNYKPLNIRSRFRN